MSTFHRNAAAKNYLRTTSRDSCEMKGFSFADSLSSFQCKSFSDLLDYGIDETTAAIGSAQGQSMDNNDMSSIATYVVDPLISGLTDHITVLSSSSPEISSVLDSNLCIGNFDNQSVFDDYEGVCGNLPVSGEWTYFGFSIDVGVGSPFHSLCPEITDGLGTHASVCIAMSKDSCTYVHQYFQM